MVVRLKLIPENVCVKLCQIPAVVETFIVATNPSKKCWNNALKHHVLFSSAVLFN